MQNERGIRMLSATSKPAEIKKPAADFAAIKDKLSAVQRTFKEAASFEEAMVESEKAVLSLFNAESLRVYRTQKQKLVTWVRQRKDTKEIQFPLPLILKTPRLGCFKLLIAEAAAVSRSSTNALPCRLHKLLPKNCRKN